jgi:hypothetical protein
MHKRYLSRYLRLILFINSLITAFVSCAAFAQTETSIKNYKVYFAAGSYQGKQLLIIRKFEQANQPSYLVTDLQSLQTQILKASQVAVLRVYSWNEVLAFYKSTPYVKAINAAQKQSLSLQDAGIIHGFPKEKGVTLTVDLCPSHKPLDRVIFTSLITEFKKTEHPVPLALSITGRFMLTHADDMVWIESLIKAGEVSVTWVNHTYNHHFNSKIPLKANFLLEPGTDLKFEILGTEMAMLQHGLLPSVFFRFPGLVSDQQVVDKVLAYGLIPVGSDAWLAKGQPANAGSIVLIHGNGNEPVGVKEFIHLLQTERSAAMQKQWLLYDLRESVEDEFVEQ